MTIYLAAVLLISFAFFRQEPNNYVGFANLPNQVHRKSVKKGFEFTLMVVGKCYASRQTRLVKVKVKLPFLVPSAGIAELEQT